MWGRKDEPATPPAPSPTREPERARPVPPPPVAAARPESSRPGAQIGKALKLKGEVAGGEDLFIDGEVEGVVDLKGHALTVGPNGSVHAAVEARSVTILGHLEGNVRASERIEIRKTGSLEGDLVTTSIAIEEGAVFRGSIDIVRPAAETAEPKQPASATAETAGSRELAGKTKAEPGKPAAPVKKTTSASTG